MRPDEVNIMWCFGYDNKMLERVCNKFVIILCRITLIDSMKSKFRYINIKGININIRYIPTEKIIFIYFTYLQIQSS